jgi:hypothetical protein
MNKVIEMQEIMFETNVDTEIILGKVQRQMDTLNISDQGTSTSRKAVYQRERNTEKQGIGGGILK